jgi:hypothetical protein
MTTSFAEAALTGTAAMDRLATTHVPSDPMDATTQPRRFKFGESVIESGQHRL